ncbi:MAG: hypothetical protein WEB00_05235 [Dehalococcoidia bacterium]
METFYATLAQISFTVLGLWWVVVQFKYREWTRNKARALLAYNVSLYFLLPGVMSLASLIDTDTSTLWRLGFGLSAACGAAASAFLLRQDTPGPAAAVLFNVSAIVTLAIYGLIALFAVYPDLAGDLGLDLEPIQVEGVLATLLLVVGVNFAWFIFTGFTEEEDLPG